MQQKPLDPKLLNINLLVPDDNLFKKMGLGEVSSLAIFEPNSDVFNKQGLFSSEIFGQLGTDARLEKLGYIDFGLHIFHPLVFRTLKDLNRRYDDIMAGKVMAVFNEDIKDFEISKDGEGDTGFDFFVKHVDKIMFKVNDSHIRKYRVSLVEKYGRSNGLYNQCLIIPAGLRDYTIDEKGVPSEDEINSHYRILIGLANRMKNITLTPNNIKLMDPIRYRIQQTVYVIYKYIQKLIDGKSKFIQAKWASRAITNSTSNVITAIPSYVKKLSKGSAETNADEIGFNTVVVGIFQYLKALGAVVPNRISGVFMANLIGDESNYVKLIDKETLENKFVELKTKTKQEWSTMEGINNIVNKLSQDVIKDQMVSMDGNYVAFIEDLGEEINVVFDLADLKSVTEMTTDKLLEIKRDIEAFKIDPTYQAPIRPITYAEMFYIAIIDCIEKFPCQVTRFPITGVGSIYPAWPYVKTTIKSREVRVNVGHNTFMAKSYPLPGTNYLRSQSVHYSHLKLLGGDHDGDTLTLTIIFTDEAIEEVKRTLASKDFYINQLGKFNYSVSNDVLDIVLKHLSE